jgi:hypothetical protein
MLVAGGIGLAAELHQRALSSLGRLGGWRWH